MNENHFTYFKVENFKRFRSFEMENIGQFNLITGDNNVGKTSVLEALLFDENPEIFAQNLYTAVADRFRDERTKEHFLSYFKNRNSEDDIKYEVQKHTKKSEITVLMSDVMDDKFAYKKERCFYIAPSGVKRKIPLISFSNGYENNLTKLYSKYIQSDRSRKQQLLLALKTILPNIEFIEVSTAVAEQPTLVITQSHVNAVMPLATFGDGAIKLFRILIDIVAHSGKQLMIDEIDAGIHHDRFTDFWRTILGACRENQVQLFATTHSLECLVFFKQTLEESEMTTYQREVRHFEIKALKNEKVKSYHYDYEQFKFALENEHEIRGGR